ncbi:MAG: hypothetical protein HC883_03815 [Bdellovibrionaceae bacterium]|nr:hypothetical protein [Pseudobdellovibrionaceae bacterium]
MRHSLFTFAVLVLSVPAAVHARTDITVGRFEDKTVKSRCPASDKFKENLDRDLQEKLITGLMGLERFQIQEREIRKIKPKHTIVGAIRTFEVCATEGRGQEVQIAIDVQLLSAKGGMTHMFSSTAQASSSAANHAPQMAMSAAIDEIIKRLDDAVPRSATMRLSSKRKKLNRDNGIW